jgi:hypothetical protein
LKELILHIDSWTYFDHGIVLNAINRLPHSSFEHRPDQTGSASRSDRIAKYNQLLRIEEELGEAIPASFDYRMFSAAFNSIAFW